MEVWEYAAVARVYVDTGLAHLDHLFDYGIPAELSESVVAGVRVKVRFNGRQADAWVVGVSAEPETDRRLSPILRVVSGLPVMPEPTVRLIRAVADHMGGNFDDVARFAIPPRHAATERAFLNAHSTETDPAKWPEQDPQERAPWSSYPYGEAFLDALTAGKTPRIAWSVAPTPAPQGSWKEGFTAAALRCLAAGRDALLIVPNATTCAVLLHSVLARIPKRFVVQQSADLGPAARYRGFLSALTGAARVVVGTRAAAYVPMPNLGLIALWDDGDDSYVERHVPYPHTRDVIALRASLDRTALIVAGHAVTTPVAAWCDTGWLTPVALTPREARAVCAAVRTVDTAPEAFHRDTRATRLPHEVFETVRAGLLHGPVLVQTPYRGYRRHLHCARCRGPVLCAACGGALAEDPGSRLRCEVCGHKAGGEGSGPKGTVQTGGDAAWACPTCGGTIVRSVVLGSARVAEELAQAFPETTVVRSDADQREEDRRLSLPKPGSVPPISTPCLVISTPGVEPPAEGGYAASVVLDAEASLARADLSAGEEAVRRWLRVVSLTTPGERGGTVLLVGPPGDRAVQAVTRIDPRGYADRELADRRAASLPPATRAAIFEGSPAALVTVAAALGTDATWLTVLDPFGVEVQAGPTATRTDTNRSRLLVMCEASHGEDLAHRVHGIVAERSRAKTDVVVARLDPVSLG